MPTGISRRRIGLATAALAAALAVTLIAGLAQPERAGARPAPAAKAGLIGALLSPVEQLVGAIDPLVRAQLPLDPRLYGAYTTRPTPSRCADGSWDCIDETIGDMDRRFAGLAPTCNHDAVFSLLYLRVTERYKQFAATPGNFADPLAVNYEDAVFSDLYTGAYDDWHAGRPQKVPPIWRLAFATADSRQATGTGDAFLGMAAHILRDLPFTLAHIGTVTHADHVAINTMLASVYDSAIAELAARFDPTMSVGALVPGTSQVFMQVVVQWREQGWRNAQALLAAPDAAARQRVADRIEKEAWLTGLTLYLGTRYPVRALTVTRDAYCASHWNT